MRYFIIIIVLISAILNAELDYNHPEFNWSTIETDHFMIHFHDETESTAREAATVAELIYLNVTNLYDYEPKQKTHLILTDPDDISNGAAYYYDNKIIIYSSPLDFALRGSHRWLQNVITHEFVHIISLQKSMKAGTKIPGAYLQLMNYEKENRPDVLYGYPNALISYPIPGTSVPPWFAEGVAQYMYSNADWDHWDSHRDMILRDRTINNNLLKFSEMNTFGKKGIGNESTYNSGFALVRHIVSKYGENSLKQISIELSKPFQFSISSSIEKVLGINGEDLYLEFKENIEADYQKKLEKTINNEVYGKIIISEGTSNFHPKWQPQRNAFAYITNKKNDFFNQTDLYIYDLNKKTEKKISNSVSYAPAWSSDGNKIYYCKKPKFPNKYGSKFYDIFSFDLIEEKEERLTYNARSFNPVFIPNIESVAFISTYDGNQNISMLDLNTLDIKKITNFNNQSMITYINYSERDNTIYFDITEHHYRDIASVSLDNYSVKYLMDNEYVDERNISLSTNGLYVFSEDKTGIFNLYGLNQSDSSSGYITNTLGGAFMPDISKKNQLLYSLYKNGSYKIALFDSISYLSNDTQVGYSNDFYKVKRWEKKSITEKNNLEKREYTDQFPEMFVMPKAMLDYNTLKTGFYFQSTEIINRLNLFGGFSINRLRDVDANFMFEFKRFYPTLFFETYYATRNRVESSKYQGVYLINDDIKFRMVQFRTGFRLPLFGSTFEVFSSWQRYRAFIKEELPDEKLNAKADYDYFRGIDSGILWRINLIKRRLDGSINPSNGFSLWSLVNFEKNKFIEGLDLSESGSLLETWEDNNLIRFQAGGSFNFEIPKLERWALTIKTEFGKISNEAVDDFFHFYAGGIPGLKGYPFYSIQGTNKLITELSFRIPIFREKNIPFMWMIFQNMTFGTIFQAGDAWVEKSEMEWKKSYGIQIRVNGFSFYNYPIAFEYELHQPLDSVTNIYVNNNKGVSYEKKLRSYIKILFDF